MTGILHFHTAVQQHIKWLDELKVCLEGGRCALDPHDIEHDDRCVIGHWLHGDGQAFAHLEAFQKVMDLHKNIHHIAARAWDAKNKGDRRLIASLMDDIDEYKHQMFLAWNELNGIIGSLE